MDIKRDPDYILITACCDATMTPAAAQPDVAKIMANPAFANLKAVRNKQVIPWLVANHSAGIRGTSPPKTSPT